MSGPILAIDPGTDHSGVVVLSGMSVEFADVLKNHDVLTFIREHPLPSMAVEMVASYGMPVGAEVFETCVWIGRMVQARCPLETVKVYRREVKAFVCGSAKAKDSNIRQELINRWGPTKEKAIGTKIRPGPLYGVKTHAWAALAVAVTVQAQRGGV